MTYIETSRLVFTELNLDDVTDKYLNWVNDPEVNNYLETRHQKHTIESLRHYVRAIIKNQNNHFFKIIVKNTHEHIGNIKVNINNYNVGNIGIMIGVKSYWGKGIGTESIDAITTWAFTHLELYKMEAGCYEQNFASLKAFLKAGFVVEGFLQGHVVLGTRRYGCFLLGKLSQGKL